jgi:FKBP-type peptidyl-prolyl cis-trans isomerase SlyD
LLDLSFIPLNIIFVHYAYAKNKGKDMKISQDAAVTINFTMSDSDGNLIDSTNDKPLTYLHGSANIMPGLEDALEGLIVGKKFDLTLTPEEGFGKKDDELVFTVNKKDFDKNAELEVDMQFQTVDEDENMVIATILEINGDDVLVDENHPLAGITLVFKGEVLDIRDATEEEISHGHIHSEDDHEHEHDSSCGHAH